MYVSVPKALISTMQGFQTILVLNVCQCSKGTHQYHARFQTILVLNVCQCSKATLLKHSRVSNNISTQCMSVFQRHSLVTCQGFNQYLYSMYVSVPKALISNIPCKGFNQYQYAMYVSIPKAPISTMQGFQTILVLNVCQCSKGTHQYHARVSSNISTQCMSVFQRHSLVTCQGFNQYLYSMYVSVPKALINTMQGFQPILVRNVCQCSKGTHQYHARVSNNISTQCMSVFQRHSLVPCKGFKQYQYSMYVSVPKALISNMHSRVSNNISTQCMSVFQRHSLVTCQGFKPIFVLNVCQCSKGTHQ